MIDLSKPSSAIVLLPLLVFLYCSFFSRPKRHPGQYPPGPKGKPLIGNAMDIRFSGRPWLYYLKLSKQLRSDIVHMSVFNVHILVLHEIEDVIALLEKRSRIYSDRPAMPITDLLGGDFNTGFLPYEDKWRRHRRIFQEAFRKERVASYHDIITDKVHTFLDGFLKDPSNFSEHCKWLAAAVTFQVTFGYGVPMGETHDRLIEAARFTGEKMAELLTPGRTIITILPFLGRIPPWVPGAYTQRLIARVKEQSDRHRNELFERMKNDMSSNSPNDCVAATMLRTRNEGNEQIYDDDTIKDTMATTYAAGVETVQNTLLIFIFAMAVYPESQRKAQMEIDRLIGTGRLPTYEDRASLPYVEALYREVRRWRPITPLGFVHTSVKDDVYKGFYIPKGTYVIPNVWAITRDEAKYRDPERFMPERFFNADGALNNDVSDYIFGFGRRICPGRHFADAEAWLAIACMLATFDITKAKDDIGNEIDLDPNAFIDSLVIRPLPFKCSILPRSGAAEKNIRVAMGTATGKA